MYDQTSIYPGKYHVQNDATRQWRSQPEIWSCKCKFGHANANFSVFIDRI